MASRAWRSDAGSGGEPNVPSSSMESQPCMVPTGLRNSCAMSGLIHLVGEVQCGRAFAEAPKAFGNVGSCRQGPGWRTLLDGWEHQVHRVDGGLFPAELHEERRPKCGDLGCVPFAEVADSI